MKCFGEHGHYKYIGYEPTNLLGVDREEIRFSPSLVTVSPCMRIHIMPTCTLISRVR